MGPLVRAVRTGLRCAATGPAGPGPGALEESLAIGHAFHDLLGSVLTLELLALVTAVEGDAAEAAVLQGAADRIWPSVGLPLFGSAYYGQPRARCEELARRELGNGPYESGLRAGAAGSGRGGGQGAGERACGPAGEAWAAVRAPAGPRENAETRRLPYIGKGRA